MKANKLDLSIYLNMFVVFLVTLFLASTFLKPKLPNRRLWEFYEQNKTKRDNSRKDTVKTDSISPKPEPDSTELIAGCGQMRRHVRTWFSGKAAHGITYHSCSAINARAEANRAETCNYGILIGHDRPELRNAVSKFRGLIKARGLNQYKAAHLVVNYVQSIPYVLIHPHSCAQVCLGAPNSFNAKYHAEGRPCRPNINPFGIHSPYEFWHTEEGDCDTRTVFLKTILTELGIDAIVVNSDVWAHSMLAVALPAPYTGSYFEHNGKRYSIWETTAMGWQLGQSPFRWNPREWYEK